MAGPGSPRSLQQNEEPSEKWHRLSVIAIWFIHRLTRYQSQT